jgi:uncharacterized protein YecE (DUF72 family)
MRLRVGTSGFAYREWKGTFYPPRIKPAEMLPFYAARLETVEINNTFYRMPKPELLASWAAETPDAFRFVVKAPRRISHIKRLEGVDDELDRLLECTAALGAKNGPLLVQTPPFFKKDTARLDAFLRTVGRRARVALEFRHDSWIDPEVHAVIREHEAALVVADTDAGTPDLVPTARWGYLRLRRTGYDEAALSAWLARVRAQPWDEAWVFFKHEDEARGPEFAERLKVIAASEGH